jgi:hypothetical protein
MFIQVLVLIGSRRKVVRLLTHFYPSILHRGCARARGRGRGRGETLYPPSPWPWFALLSANGPATEEATLGWCGVVWRPVRVIGPPVSLSAGTRGTSEPENGRVLRTVPRGREGRHVGGEGASGGAQRCSGVTCGAKTMEPSTVPPHFTLPSPSRLASPSPHPRLINIHYPMSPGFPARPPLQLMTGSQAHAHTHALSHCKSTPQYFRL